VYKYVSLLSLLFVVCIAFNISAATTDPTKPFGYSASSVEIIENKLLLQSIVHGDGTRIAVINGTVIKEGDILGQYKVAQIDDNSVILRDGSDSIKLHIFKNTVLK
jgi:hypothetical protein